MTKEQRNAYMKEWNRKHMAAMTQEERAAYNKRKNERDKLRRATVESSREQYNARMRQWNKAKRAAMSKTELTAFRRKKWAVEKRRMEKPEAIASHRAASTRYSRSRKEKFSAYHKLFVADLKAEMLAAYGPACKCCGEPEPVFLTLDHINGDGVADRKARNVRGGYALYLKLRKEGWPEGYQALCFNCNSAKRTSPVCPHKAHYLKLVTASRNP